MAAVLTLDESAGLQNDDTTNTIPPEFKAVLDSATGSLPIARLALSGFGTPGDTGDDLVATFGSNITDVRFTITGDLGLGEGVDSGLVTTGGRKIFLYVSSTNNNVVIGREGNANGIDDDPAGSVVFGAFLDTQTPLAGDAGATGARLWVAEYGPMRHPNATNPNDIVSLQNLLNIVSNSFVEFSAAGAPSGQNLFMMFGDGTPHADDVTMVVTGKDGGTVNSGQGGGTTTLGSNNQMVDPGEGMYCTFVKGANTNFTVPNLDQNEADLEANIDFATYFGATAASFAVVQLQPPKGSTLKITAIDNKGTLEKGPAGTFISGLTPLANADPALDEFINIVSVTISRMVTTGKTTVLKTFTFTEGGPLPADTGGLTVNFSTDDTATVGNVKAGDRILYSTGAVNHNRVLIDNVGSGVANLNSAFDIGSFRLESGALSSNGLGPIDFADDGPTSAAALDTGSVRHDETAGNQNGTDADDLTGPLAAFSGILDISSDMGPGYARGSAAVISSAGKSGGTDGLSATAYSLDVSAAGVDSGLDTTEGNEIRLYKEGNLVVGRIFGGTDGGEAAFAVAIDSATGVLSMVQYHSIKHPTTGASSPDESLSINNAALLAVATVTDGDGDTHAASVPIGARVSIQDDGPVAAAVLSTGSVRHDETAGLQVPPDADDVTGPLGVFSTVANVSLDMTAGYATGSAAVVAPTGTVSGVDGLASTVYSLRASAENVDSGLDTTEGDSILLVTQGDMVVGRISSAGASNGKAAFAVSIDPATGVLSMVQYHSIRHPTGGAVHDESLAINNAALLAVVTVTDGDGDTSQASVAIGAQVSVQDDGPVAAAVLGTGVVRHDETPLNQADADDLTGPLTVFDTVSNKSTDMSAGFARGTAAALANTGTQAGVDGLAGTVFSLGVSASDPDSGLLTTEGDAISLVKEGDLVVGRILSAGPLNGKAAFAISIDAASGILSMVQYHSIRHPNGGTATPDESLSIANAALLGVVTVTDGDGDTSAASVPIGALVSIQDDGPVAAAVLGTGEVRHDETAGVQNAVGDADDVAGPLAAFSGVTPVSSDMVPGYATGSAAVVASTGTVAGVDGAASTVFSIEASAANVDSGLKTTEGNDILLTTEGALVVGRISGGANNGKAAFAVAIDSATGVLSMVQYHSIRHNNTASQDESLSISNAALRAVVTVTDGDGDISSAFVGIGARVSIQDDGPAITGRSDLVYSNASNPTPGGTGFFGYTIGQDQRVAFSALNSDFTGVALTSGNVGAAAISNPVVTWASETGASAQFNVAFDYISNPALNTTTHATGTLVFDKGAGTYTLALANQIQSFTVLTTSTAKGFTGYELNQTTVDNTQPAVSVATLATNFFVQFSGYTEPGGGTGVNNLDATGKDGNDNAFSAGELFQQAGDWVSVSGTAAGVAGDTIQKGEVLDLDFFIENPSGFTAATPTAEAAGIFMKFDGIGSEDLVVVLKLKDSTGVNLPTTKAIVVDNADIFKSGATLPAGYNITLDNNDGVVIIESDDFNGVGDHWVIVGAQVLVSTEGITGSGSNLNPLPAEPLTQAFGDSTTDNDVIKISDMGFLTTVTPTSKLTFTAAVVDADGDATASQQLDVTIVSGTTYTAGADREAIQGRSGVADTFVFGTVGSSPTGVNHDVVSGFVTGIDKFDLSGIDAIAGGANDSFSFIGGAAFGAAGQLRFDAGTSSLQGDVDGDGVADIVIELVGFTGPIVAGDIIP